jgi:hypothetical protein
MVTVWKAARRDDFRAQRIGLDSTLVTSRHLNFSIVLYRPSPAGGERDVSGSSIRSVFSRRYATGSGALTASCPRGSRAGSVIKSKDPNAMAAPNIM